MATKAAGTMPDSPQISWNSWRMGQDAGVGTHAVTHAQRHRNDGQSARGHLFLGDELDAGVSDLRIQTFFDHVQKFNNTVDPAWLTTGFENAKPSDLKYDPYSMQDAWTEKYDTFPGWNCRITACGLFGDFITVTGKADLDHLQHASVLFRPGVTAGPVFFN